MHPHTDTPKKIITLVVSMVRNGEWDPTYGGGTEVVFPKDPTRSYNFAGDFNPKFDEVETLSTYDFNPNQAVVFVKTFNSWHAVRPMTVADETIFRRTLTINIELSY